MKEVVNEAMFRGLLTGIGLGLIGLLISLSSKLIDKLIEILPKKNKGQAPGKSPECYMGVVPGTTVRHKLYGEGTVKSMDNFHITVSFGDREQECVFPDAFINGVLSKL